MLKTLRCILSNSGFNMGPMVFVEHETLKKAFQCRYTHPHTEAIGLKSQFLVLR